MNDETLEDLSYLYEELADLIHDLDHCLDEVEPGTERNDLRTSISYAQTALLYLCKVVPE